MTDLEKLARDICWAGFYCPPKVGKNKYWVGITPAARASYIIEAKEFVLIVNKLGQQRIQSVFHRVIETPAESAHVRATSGA